ncbi:hypothetical protein JRO89_XS02G0236900 [Xanthoceras sorbifolium]|uniref:laccase n=1 Tax=Xanthoceras sorbifolium TaxID=99658 RepID=A0ABQ8IH77_9ROSI|nr:hypothetical protein JRO89_XS02G0236900 [Xanthoceras sorbifolium]
MDAYRSVPSSAFVAVIFFSFIALSFLPQTAHAITRHYKFDIKLHNVTRLCRTKSIVSVNGQFPGPRIVAREGDRLLIKVVNHVQNNITIHWHGVRQFRSGWADGPAYITQCPIQTGQSYVYNFTIDGQRGTAWWHAHISWLRSTLYGPIIILPKRGVPYPFSKPYKEIPIILGDWYNADPEAIIKRALQTGGGPNVSDAYTINGLTGPLYDCSANDTFRLKVKPGKTYLLRIINAALNAELFFGIANHTLTVVEADIVYVKPFGTKIVFLSPGQTTNVLLETKSDYPNAEFSMIAQPYVAGHAPFDNSSVAGLGTSPCEESNKTCQGPFGPRTRYAASVNNVSFTMPKTSILQSHFLGQPRGVYTPDFPTNPENPFNYTGTPPDNTMVSNGTKVVVLPFNTSVELIMQDTSILGADTHPLHLHGYNFFVVGQGLGNFDPKKDPASFNLVDPVERNTVGVPVAGWVAVRFLANNPGAYLHIYVHSYIILKF